MDTLRGVVERITFHNEENGYTVAKVTPESLPFYSYGAPREVTVIGNMPSLNVGESVEMTGRWTVHGDYGKQFVVEQLRTVLPATIAGMEKYLGSGLIRGVGPVTAKRIVKHFGLDTLTVIENAVERLLEVSGVGRKRVQMIMHAWAEQRAIKEVMLFLQSHGVSTSLATKIYKQYGDDAIAVVRADPYRLARDIFGIGFLTADKIAQSLGMAPDAPQRIAAGVVYALNQATDEGHVFLPTSELVQQAGELLHVAPQQVAAGMVELHAHDEIMIAEQAGGEAISVTSRAQLDARGMPQIVAEQGQLYASATVDQMRQLLAEERAIYLTPMYYSEVGVARRLLRLLREGVSRFGLFQQMHFDWDGLLAAVEERDGISLAPQQRAAVQATLAHRLTVLTGGPGTGKTTTVRTVLAVCQALGRRVLLAAPTGRAAKRLAETTGAEAKTLHRLLEFKPGEGIAFQRNEDNPLDADLLIVDEASMLDLVLMNHLLRAVQPGTHLLLVGDVDQLPSVGAGNVLQDIIAAVEGQITDASLGADEWSTGAASRVSIHGAQSTVIRLQTIFRQEANSYIISNAHRINAGQLPILDNDSATDFFLFKVDEPERAAQLCIELVQSRIPRRFAIPSADIQVLSPMHRGIVGVGALNDALQAALNPPAENKMQKLVGSRAFRRGDRVMQIRNNYDKEVYNGDMGVISAVDLELQTVTVVFDGRPLVYDFLELDELVHAYAISVHKSQGSEYPAVVIPVLTSHYMMLQRNLLYTAVTRARRLVVLVGQPRAIALAVRNDKVAERFSGLRQRLTGMDV